MPQRQPRPTREEIVRAVFEKSLDLREEIDRLPVQFRDYAIQAAIIPLLDEGKGITPRRIVLMRERILHRLVKEYFKRQYSFDAYTDEEFWVRKRVGGRFAQENTPIPDVFAGDFVPFGKLVIPEHLVVAEVKKNTSAKSVRDCRRVVKEYLKFANRVYAAFSLAPPFSIDNVIGFSREIPDVGVLLVDPSLKQRVREIRAAKDHTPSDQTRWSRYCDQLRCAKAWEKQGRRPAGLHEMLY